MPWGLGGAGSQPEDRLSRSSVGVSCSAKGSWHCILPCPLRTLEGAAIGEKLVAF